MSLTLPSLDCHHATNRDMVCTAWLKPLGEAREESGNKTLGMDFGRAGRGWADRWDRDGGTEKKETRGDERQMEKAGWCLQVD